MKIKRVVVILLFAMSVSATQSIPTAFALREFDHNGECGDSIGTCFPPNMTSVLGG